MGGFDLSIPGFIVASALIVTQVRERWGISFLLALLVALAGAACFGALAGQICQRLDIQPLIVTLAIGGIVVGLAQAQTPGGLTAGSSTPQWLNNFASPSTKTLGLDVPPLVITWALVAVGLTIFLHRTTGGRRLLATGANPRAADYSLINTRRVWTLAFAFSAVASSLVGLAVAGFGGAITNESGDPYLFQSVVAVIVGGTIFGGPGDYLRTVVGSLFLTVLSIVLVGHGTSSADQQIIFGAAILLAVSFYGRERRLRDRM
jgi:ribose transport system permease protein